MTIDDIQRVYELEYQLFPNPWPRSFFESDLSRPFTVALVVEIDGIIIGYALANCYAVEFHITNIAVDTVHQRQGIATQLIAELESIAETRGCANTYLEVRTNNIAAIELYRKLGYVISQTRKNYYIDGDDAYVMQKSL